MLLMMVMVLTLRTSIYVEAHSRYSFFWNSSIRALSCFSAYDTIAVPNSHSSHHIPT